MKMYEELMANQQSTTSANTSTSIPTTSPTAMTMTMTMTNEGEAMKKSTEKEIVVEQANEHESPILSPPLSPAMRNVGEMIMEPTPEHSVVEEKEVEGVTAEEMEVLLSLLSTDGKENENNEEQSISIPSSVSSSSLDTLSLMNEVREEGYQEQGHEKEELIVFSDPEEMNNTASPIRHPSAEIDMNMTKSSPQSTSLPTSIPVLPTTTMTTTMTTSPMIPSTSSICSIPLTTPPRPSNKRAYADVVISIQNDSPVCSPSKIVSTSLPVLPVLPTPSTPIRSTHSSSSSSPSFTFVQTFPTKTKVVEKSPTKVGVEEEREGREGDQSHKEYEERHLTLSTSNSIPSAPYPSSLFTPITETGQPLSTRMRCLLAQQEEEHARFQQQMHCQTEGLYSSFLTDRENKKVGFIIIIIINLNMNMNLNE